MDRQFAYPGAIPLETDLLNTNRNMMVGLAKLAKALLGATTTLFDFTCTQTSPASMTVNVGPGQIYAMAELDATAYSSLAADTTDMILKQGILWSAVNLACPAPTTAGYSINYLVEIGYQDVDTNSVVLPYYNSTSPTTPYSGPNNTGASQPTTRQGAVSVQVKAGSAASTGSQTTPSADSGYVPAFVVTVAYGQTSITSTNISTPSNAPFLTAGFVANALTQTAANLLYAQLAVTNTFTQPQTVPNATAGTHALNLSQANGLYSPRDLAINFGANGNPLPNQYLAIVPIPNGITASFPANFANSEASCLSAPTSALSLSVVTIPQGSTTQTSVGTISFAASGLTGTFASAGGAAVNVVGPAILAIIAPSTSDATFGNIGGSLYGSR